MTNGCLLESWGQNSRIDHGVADSITGPCDRSAASCTAAARNVH
jgi:hypothetical protein